MNEYIEKFVDWARDYLGKTLMIIGVSLMIIPVIYMSFSINIIIGIMTLGFFIGLLGSVLYSDSE